MVKLELPFRSGQVRLRQIDGLIATAYFSTFGLKNIWPGKRYRKIICQQENEIS